MIECALEARPCRAAVVGTEGVGEHLDARAIVSFDYLGQQVCQRVRPKIGTGVANAQPVLAAACSRRRSASGCAQLLPRPMPRRGKLLGRSERQREQIVRIDGRRAGPVEEGALPGDARIDIVPGAGLLLHVEQGALRLGMIRGQGQGLAQQRQRFGVAALRIEACRKVDERVRRIRVERKSTLEACARVGERAHAMLANAEVEP